jgi:hypothetical protein
MPMMLIVLMVLTTITVVLIGTSARDVESSRTSAGRTEARLLASSVLEDIYARIRENPREAFTFASGGDLTKTSGFETYKALRTQSTPSVWAVLPTGPRDGTVTDPLNAAGKSIGSVECPNDFSRDCFFVRVKSITGADDQPGAFTVYVGLRLRCGGSESRCIYVAFEQRLRRAQFYDFALANEFSTLAPEALFPAGSWRDANQDPPPLNDAAYKDYKTGCATTASGRSSYSKDYIVELGEVEYVPNDGGFAATGESVELSGCIDIAYRGNDQGNAQGNDNINAPIYTGDEYLTVCGTPKFGQVFLAGKGSEDANKWFKVSGGCDLPVDTSLRDLPHQLNFPVMALPTSTDYTKTAARYSRTFEGRPVVVNLASSANVTIVDGDGKAATLDAVVYGNVSGQKSVIVLNGSVAIIGDIKYDEPVSGSESKNSFSLTASERIEIWQSCSGGTGAPAAPSTFTGWSNTASCVPGGPATRTVHGILTSPAGFIGVPDWLTNFEEDRTQAPLEFFGSMASKYQGVFGSFTSDGALVSGFKKNFTHDTRFTQFVNGAPSGRPDTFADGFALPPFVVESEVPVWLRLDLSEVGYSES